MIRTWWRGRSRRGQRGRPLFGRPVALALEPFEDRLLLDVGIAGLEASLTFVGSLSNPSVVGKAVALTAVVVPEDGAGPTPTGTVTFRSGGRPLGTAALTNGLAVLVVNNLPVTTETTHPVIATYHGDVSYFGSASGQMGQFVGAVATTTTVTAAPNPSTVGQTVTFTVTVTSQDPGAGIPTGGVVITADGDELAEAVLDGLGRATITHTFDTSGTFDIVAKYEGDDTFAESTSSVLRQTVARATTVTVLESDVELAVFGQPVTLTASVSVNEPGEGAPTGTVTFRAGELVLGEAELGATGVGGETVATLTVDDIPVGTVMITAVYEGDNNFAGSTSAPVTISVSRASTLVFLDANPEQAGFGEPITFTSRVEAAEPSTGTPTGLLVLLDRNVALATAQLVNGTAKFVLTNLSLGRHPITVRYEGSPGYEGGFSGEVTVAVGTFNQRWVGTAYRNLLQRPVDPSGLMTFAGLLELGLSFSNVALQLMNACAGAPLRCEFFEVTVRDLYRQLLRRGPDPGGLAGNVEFLRQGGTIAGVKARLLASNEYFTNTQWGGAGNTSGWLTALFRDVLDRALTNQERTFWLQVIAQGATRESVALSLLRTTESLGRVVQGYFQRLLLRPAGPDEVASVVPQLQAGRREEELIAAILGSQEYGFSV